MPMAANRLSREEEFMQELDERICDLREHVAQGRCESFDKYCASAGEYRALIGMQIKLEQFFASDEDEDE